MPYTHHSFRSTCSMATDTIEQRRPIADKSADIGPHTSDVDSEKADTNSGYKQEGVVQVEAITAAWTKKSLWITFAWSVTPYST